MAVDVERRRVLLVAATAERARLRSLFDQEVLHEWEALEADSFERARFILQHDVCCDVLLVDESLYRHDDSEGLSWLAAQREAPVVFLAGAAPETIIDVLERGVNQWLPRDLALSHPDLVLAILHQALHWNEQRQRIRLAGEALYECRRQVSRLVSLLWETTPAHGRTRWLTQRHMLERLQEEIARSERYANTLTVVLGEVRVDPAEGAEANQPPHLAAWTAEQIGKVKRRSDVAGQYGPHGFMLLLPQTTAAGAVQCCRRLQEKLEHAAPSPGTQAQVRTYFGIASLSDAARTAKSLVSTAEQHLEKAKQSETERFATE